MKYIEIDNTQPNQSFTFSTDNGTVEITLSTIDDITLFSMSSGGNNIISSVKVPANELIIGYKHIQEQYGDFIFTTDDNNYPNFKDFNQSNKLYWLNYDEVKQFKESKNA